MSEKQILTQDTRPNDSEAARMFEIPSEGELAPVVHAEDEYKPLQGVNEAHLKEMREQKRREEALELEETRRQLNDPSSGKRMAKSAVGGVALAGAILGGTAVLVESGKEMLKVASDKAKARELKEQKQVPESNSLQFDTEPKFVVNDKGATEVQINMSVKDAMGKTIDYDFDVGTLGLSIEQAGSTNIEVADLKSSSQDITGKVIRFKGGVDGSRQIEVTITTIHGSKGGFKVFKSVKIMDSEGKLLTPPQQTEVKGVEDTYAG